MLSKTGGSAKLVQFIKLGSIIGITSQTIIEEVEKQSLRIGKTVEEIRLFIKNNRILVRKKITKMEVTPYKDMVAEDDLHVVAGAKLTKSNYLITLDKKHLLKDEIREAFKPLKVVNPKEYLERLV